MTARRGPRWCITREDLKYRAWLGRQGLFRHPDDAWTYAADAAKPFTSKEEADAKRGALADDHPSIEFVVRKL